MVTENALMLWLVYAAVAATFFLVVGALAVCVRTQQVERLRLIQWAMVACLLAPLANQLPGFAAMVTRLADNFAAAGRACE